jgi:RHS repeat-associated protein
MPVAAWQPSGVASGRPAETAGAPVAPPQLSLPKGGGAIRGIGETFTANPVTGTAAVTVPIATSPGRSGFGPQLTLTYDSGTGNGPFGLGWSLSLPAITRRTDRGLPRYDDAGESDTYLLSGSEELVPAYKLDPSGAVVRDADGDPVPDVADRGPYRVVRYRPRTEGLFARIERWTPVPGRDGAGAGEVHWRVISRENVTTCYGRTAASRIADPQDPSRVFSWLICESYDDRGNAIVYDYKPEDSARVGQDADGQTVASAHERNRSATSRAANRYPKTIRYGNRTPNRDAAGRATDPTLLTDWMFTVVFDYHDGHYQELPDDPADDAVVAARLRTTPHAAWPVRQDPFSSYRAGFELRTYRLCRRVLMFHHFPTELGAADQLVRSTDFSYAEGPVVSVLSGVTQSGYRPLGGDGVDGAARYLRRSMPPVEFGYSRAPTALDLASRPVEQVAPESVENLPAGVDGASYRWIDLDGDGAPGILTEQAGAWFYKRNHSPAGDASGRSVARFGATELVVPRPAATLEREGLEFLDLAGDGQMDLVQRAGPVRGFYERIGRSGWAPFRPFETSPDLDPRDPNLRLVDLDGDGHPDLLLTEQDVLTWYPSLAEAGYGPARRAPTATDEERGPVLVFADGTNSIYLADLCGDGLADLVRIRNGEVCYWPNLGYGCFGPKVTMDNPPWFDEPDQFDQRRIRVADGDGSGVADIFYLHRDGVRIYFNQAGNAWSDPVALPRFPVADDLASVQAFDLLGTGTACLVWSSPLPGHASRPMRYLELTVGTKPYLLTRVVNNLGAETHIAYKPSTHFAMRDELAGRPWISRLPFPVQVIDRVVTVDRVSRTRLVTSFAYHHGQYDDVAREFSGFGLVEQWDSEEIGALGADEPLADPANTDPAASVPPVLTRSWYHTGIYLGRDHVSDYFAGFRDRDDHGEYYREPGRSEAELRALLLPDTLLPAGLTLEEDREACRALRGVMLRREVYALDGTAQAGHPYTVTEQSFTARLVQPRAGNRHAVFLTSPGETIEYRYERDPSNPRIGHMLTLEVDHFGNTLKEATVAYGRRPGTDPDLTDADRARQALALVTYVENRLTEPISDPAVYPDDHRIPLACETRTYELTGYQPTGPAGRFRAADFVQPGAAGLHHVLDNEIDYADQPTGGRQRRLIEHVRTLYRSDDLGAARDDPLALLALGRLEPLGLFGESYKLAFTPALLARSFQRGGASLLPDPAAVLDGPGPDRGGYRRSQHLKAAGVFPASDRDDHWWLPSGRVFLAPSRTDSAATELANARQHFFLPRRYRDPFHTSAVSTESVVDYDDHDLLPVGSRDPLGNRVTVGERLAGGGLDPARPGNDYRVLAPRMVTDPNGNRAEVAHDALAMVVGTAVLGRPGEDRGDSLEDFVADLSERTILDHVGDPLADPHAILGRATARLVYDLFAYQRTHGDPQPRPAAVYTLERHTHDADLEPGKRTGVQHAFAYSDGFGREIQRKLQAEPGPLVDGGPVVEGRWVGSGWTVFNNKGKPAREYEPFFSATPGFEFGVQTGVSPVLFYDPVERVVATLHPNHAYEKVVFDPWRQVTYDVNDTVAPRGAETGDPRTDPDIGGYVERYFAALPADPAGPWQTWYARRRGGALGAQEQAAATRAAAHADTPIAEHLDPLGRVFLTLAHLGFAPDGAPIHVATRIELDIEGNLRVVRDTAAGGSRGPGRLVMRYAYDMLGNRISQAGMDSGQRWTLNDAAGKPIRAWDSRGHATRTTYDPLRRPVCTFVTGADPAHPTRELLTERVVYGEQHPQAEARNLRGRPHLQLDQAGMVANEEFDFTGNLARATRRLVADHEAEADWRPVDAALPAAAATAFDPALLAPALDAVLEAEVFASATTYDALDRPVRLTLPHPAGQPASVVRYGYNAANLMERVEVNLRGALGADGRPVWSPVVVAMDYDAKGRRRRIDLGNGASTEYRYDQLTFRLTRLLTRRPQASFPDDCPRPPSLGWPGCELQQLHYTYDPVGNVTHIRDDAQQAIFFRNRRVEPSADYTYDALYRLVEATGREHLGQARGAPVPHSAHDGSRIGIAWSDNDGAAMGTYSEQYTYDTAGNILQITHRGTDPAHPGWTRGYTYAEPSLLRAAGGSSTDVSNRLSSTAVGTANPTVERYAYDGHGNLTRLPHLGGAHPTANLGWDHGDRLRWADLGGGGSVHHLYDNAGQRVRKVWRKSPGLVEERTYLGGIELFRRRDGAGTVVLERETVDLMVDAQRVALVETRTVDTAGNDPGPRQLVRYQLGNHLGSAQVELDGHADIISYEEYTPYGSTSYQAVRSRTETPKRLRASGKERDQETGLVYHGRRYYAPWLGRWTRPDPLGLRDSTNVYSYVLNNPIIATDPTGGPAWFVPVLIYIGYKALTSGAETAIETGVAKATGDKDFSVAGSFLKNMVVNSTIGLIPGTSEAKIATKVVVYGGKLALRTTADATLDTIQGKGEFSDNLATSGIGNVGGDAAGLVLRRGVGALIDSGTKKVAPELGGEVAKKVGPDIGSDAVEKLAKDAPVTSTGVSAATKAAAKAVDPQLDANIISALINPKDAGHAAAVAFATANQAAGLSINRHTYKKILSHFSKDQIRKLRETYGIKLIREVDLPEIDKLAGRLERAFAGTGRVLSAEDARVAATAFLRKERLATADVQFFYRAKDLGLDVELVGPAPRVAQAAAYVPQLVTIPAN